MIMMTSKCILFLLLLMVQSIHAQSAEFDEAVCLRCVRQHDDSFESSSSSFYSNMTYCELSEDNYKCIGASESCPGDSAIWEFDCYDLDDVFELARTAVIAFSVVSCLCCAGIIGGIVACVFCCVKGGQQNHNHPTVYQQPVTKPVQAALVLPGTLNTTTPAAEPEFTMTTTAAETGLAKETT